LSGFGGLADIPRKLVRVPVVQSPISDDVTEELPVFAPETEKLPVTETLSGISTSRKNVPELLDGSSTKSMLGIFVVVIGVTVPLSLQVSGEIQPM